MNELLFRAKAINREKGNHGAEFYPYATDFCSYAERRTTNLD